MSNSNIVTVVKKELEKRNMTYRELSALSGVPLDTLNNFFRGKTKNPRIDTVQAIQEALGLSPALEWTEEDRALGVGSYPEYYSDDEKHWMDLRSLIIENHGKNQYETVAALLEAWAKQKK